MRRLDDWWLRADPGGAWWVATVLPHGEADDTETLRRVVLAERFHAAHGGPARFQITAQACPDGLDALLAARGYRRQSPIALCTARVAEVRRHTTPAVPRAEVAPQPSPEWLRAWHTAHGGDATAEADRLARVELPSGYASVARDGAIVGVGRVVLDDGWAGVFNMVTLPRARGRGIAGEVLRALSDWAAEHDAMGMYLQVECDNTPARRLYARAGFRELTCYHYRVAPESAPRQRLRGSSHPPSTPDRAAPRPQPVRVSPRGQGFGDSGGKIAPASAAG